MRLHGPIVASMLDTCVNLIMDKLGHDRVSASSSGRVPLLCGIAAMNDVNSSSVSWSIEIHPLSCWIST